MDDQEKQIGPFISAKGLELLDEYIRQKYRIQEIPDRYIETQEAMLEFMNKEKGAAVEAILREIDDYLVNSSEEYADRRITENDLVIPFTRKDPQRFRPIVSRDLYAEFKQFVKSLSPDISISVAIEIALRERREGGRKRRVANRAAAMLNALDPDGAGDRDLDLGLDHRDRLLEEITDDADDVDDYDHPPHTEDGKLERIRAEVAEREGKQVEELYQASGEIPKQYFIDAIDEYCTRTRDTANLRTREKYLDLVEQDLGS